MLLFLLVLFTCLPPLAPPPSCRLDAVHVVVDPHLVSGQNEQSTLTAVQNLILLSNTGEEGRGGEGSGRVGEEGEEESFWIDA